MTMEIKYAPGEGGQCTVNELLGLTGHAEVPLCVVDPVQHVRPALQGDALGMQGEPMWQEP